MTTNPDTVRARAFAWTATSGYRQYPSYVNLTGNRLIVRGAEQDATYDRPFVTAGSRVEVDLPDDAIADLLEALTRQPVEVTEVLEGEPTVALYSEEDRHVVELSFEKRDDAERAFEQIEALAIAAMQAASCSAPPSPASKGE